jgi:hypothetical protein
VTRPVTIPLIEERCEARERVLEEQSAHVVPVQGGLAVLPRQLEQLEATAVPDVGRTSSLHYYYLAFIVLTYY